MAATLHKFLKSSSSSRILTALRTPQTSIAPTHSLLHQPHEAKNNDPTNLNPLWGSDKIVQSRTPLQFYPSFSLGYFLNPISVNGFNQLGNVEGVDEAGEDSRKIWADSVKKKRKRKMNKHKYKKLRKRLRRKT